MINFVPISQDNTQQVFRFAHISDPHLSSLKDVPWRELLNKRILGYLSWRLSRRHIHRRDILKALIEDLDSRQAQHLLISGDLTHIGTPIECQQVKNWLNELGPASDISVIPGNHDAYIKTDKSQTTDLWASYMDGDAESKAAKMVFPSLRQRGPVAIIGVSSAVPTAPFFATGRIGNKQLELLAQILKQTREQGLFRIIAIHHGPLVDSNKFRKRLIDSERFRSVINAHGAELILHGHGHYPVSDILITADAEIPVIGVASASLLSSSKIKRAGYNVYDVNASSSDWKLQMQSFGYDQGTDKFLTREEKEFVLPRLQNSDISGQTL
ncbi:MAG: metallophosphoesterase [Gammaproteobacteria bacterium]|jgi:3',5'-cyclic AMP phosphodiesterase CpdA|nr:metallophosphoesterase [Gammaproteobacteria bacterium]